VIIKTIDDNPHIEETAKEIIRKFDQFYNEKDILKIKDNIDAAKVALDSFESKISKLHIYYSIATGYGDIIHINLEKYSEEILIGQLYNFRMAIDLYNNNAFSDDETPHVRGCLIQLFTNYANALSNIGRIIEAINYYKMALSIHSGFAMAEGNLGNSYIRYADLDFDKGHSQIFHHCAYKYLKSAINHKSTIVEIGALEYFQRSINIFSPEYIEGFLEKELDIKTYSLGQKNESNYRKWVMEQCLFLNTMNDLPFIGSFIAADTLQLPNMIRKTSDGLDYKHHGLFNQIKQEYITARYLIYESFQESGKTHFADKNIHLMDTLDYTVHSIRVEKMKFAFRVLYSLYDKIAHFINDYFELKIPSRRVGYSILWNDNHPYKQILHSKDNWMLNALYWLSKEFFDTDETPEDSIKPQARRIYNMRQALEHRYLKITEYDMESSRRDSLALYVSYEEFKRETLDLVHLVRESIIYLSLSVHVNENKKRAEKPDAVYANMQLFEFDDEWKT
jgi:hypothetical protein